MTPSRERPRFARVFNVHGQRLRCDRCRAVWKSPHRYLLDLDGYRLLCACARCTAACLEDGRSSLRVVPGWVRKVLGWAPARSLWHELELPGIALFLRSSRLDGWLSIFPSALGALDGDLAAEELSALLADSGVPARVALDVEALLVDARHAGPLHTYIVPIDVCFALSALVRQVWPSLGEGAALRELDLFFARLEQRAVPLRALQRVRLDELPSAPSASLSESTHPVDRAGGLGYG